MKQTIFKHLVFLPLLVLILACGGNDIPSDFQQNEPAGFQLTEVTEGYGAVDDAYNSVDAHEFNVLLDKVVEASEREFEIAQYATADILGDAQAPVGEMVRIDTAGLLARLVNPGNYHFEKDGVDSFYPLDGQAYTQGFYDFLDRFSGDGYTPPEDYISGLVYKVTQQTFIRMDRSLEGKQWLNSEMANLIDDIQDPKFQDDFTDVAKLLTKALIQTDYPVWLGIDGLLCDYSGITAGTGRCAVLAENLDLGNAARGTSELVQWLNVLIHNSETRQLVHDMLLGFFSVLDPADGDDWLPKIQTLVENMEDNFTVGGAVYAANAVYNENSLDSGTGHEVYSDAELGQTVREASTLLQQLFVGSDRPQSMIVSKAGQAPVYPLDLMNQNLRNIGFNPDSIDIEGSIDDLIRRDMWGRDRVNDPEAWPVSHLETLFFLTQVTAGFGWKDAGLNAAFTPLVDSRTQHYQGEYAEELTLNDALFSMRMIRTSGYFGPYEMAFFPTNGNHLYRTRTAFTLAEVNDLNDGVVDDDSGDGTPDKDYRFFYNQNYGVLQFLAGPGPGDLGAPDGGNPNGESLELNQYRAYAPNGLHETQLGGWTMGWGVRACFGGEGPYYYADPNAEIVSANGKSYYKYLRPDGRIYAYVSMDHTEYLYPVDDNDTADTDPATQFIDGQPQRDNRYKAVWHSDYYVGHYSHVTSTVTTERFFTIDNSSGKSEVVAISDPSDSASSLTYHELIAEDEPMRACASPEEAFFRNYQWVMNEKKMVMVIPMYFDLSGIKGIAFQIQECNGWSGLANLRIFRENHVWAKQGTDGTSDLGNSIIPGDYRFEVLAAPDDGQESIIGAETIYSSNIDSGTANPAIVSHNLPALYRLAFPRSAEMDRGNGISDRILGSKEFSLGDDNWEHRNAFMPILFSLLAGLREYTPAYDPDARTAGINAGMRAFLNQTAIWIKPLFYYNRAETGTSGQKPPAESWIPRVYGIYDTNGDGIDDRPVYSDYYVHQGAPFLTSAADFYATYVNNIYNYRGLPPNYYGSEAEQRFYQPATMKTILNVLIDSDITAEDNLSDNRCNGLLPLITESVSRPLTRFFKLFLNSEVTAPPLEQIFTAIKFTKGPLTEINESNSVKGMDFPEWMFVSGDEGSLDDYGAYAQYLGGRDEDIILDDILDIVVGHDAIISGGDYVLDGDGNPLKGYGLANFPDEQERLALAANDPLRLAIDPSGKKEPWKRFYDYVLTAADLLHENSPYCISENLLQLIDRTFARDELYSADEIAGFMYAAGKLLGYYNGASWVYQGQPGQISEMYNMLSERVPAMNILVTQNEMSSQTLTPADIAAGYYGWGDHYYAQLIFAQEAAAADGLIEYLINTMSTPRDWGTTLNDLHRFVTENPDVAGTTGEFWPTVAKLLRDMGKAVGDTLDGNPVGDILREYGFQVN